MGGESPIDAALYISDSMVKAESLHFFKKKNAYKHFLSILNHGLDDATL